MREKGKFPDSPQPRQIIWSDLFAPGVFDKACSKWIMHELTIKSALAQFGSWGDKVKSSH